jgi:hypothetical protein
LDIIYPLSLADVYRRHAEALGEKDRAAILKAIVKDICKAEEFTSQPHARAPFAFASDDRGWKTARNLA